MLIEKQWFYMYIDVIVFRTGPHVEQFETHWLYPV